MEKNSDNEKLKKRKVIKRHVEVSEKATAFFFKDNKTFLVLSDPKIMALPSFGTSIKNYESTRRKIPEESNF